MWWSRKTTNAEYQHEKESLVKQVPSASDISLKNYRKKRPGRYIWISSCIAVGVSI